MTKPQRKSIWIMEQKLHKVLREIEVVQKDIEERKKVPNDNDFAEAVMVLDSAKSKIAGAITKLEGIREWNEQLKRQLR